LKTEQTDYQFLTQLTRITAEKQALRHDDRLEAVAGAVKYWVEFMARDMNTAVDETRAAALEAELKKFTDDFHVRGVSGQEDCQWFRTGG
jgi:hypothetical protein